MKHLLGISFLLLSLTGCQTVESISISQIPASKARSNEVRSEASSPIVFGIPFGTAYIDEAKNDLLSHCPAPRRIEGVLTNHVNTNYFFGLLFSQSVSMRGYCLASNATAPEAKASEFQKQKTKVKSKPKKNPKREN